MADFAPLTFTIHSDIVFPEGYVPRVHEDMDTDRGDVGTDYLATLRTPLLAGRDFNDSDTANGDRVAIVNQAFVNRYWPGQQAIAFVGDGGALMTGNELATARLYGVNPIIVVSDNKNYGTIAMHHINRYPGRPYESATRLQNPIGRNRGSAGV